jgi:hypothetical protein
MEPNQAIDKHNKLAGSSVKRSFGGAGITIDRTFELAFGLSI